MLYILKKLKNSSPLIIMCDSHAKYIMYVCIWLHIGHLVIQCLCNESKLQLRWQYIARRTLVVPSNVGSCWQADGASDEAKREQMERLVREELERWDSESSIGQTSARGPSPGGSSRGPRTHSRPSSGPSGVRYRLIAMISCQFLKLMWYFYKK